MLNDTLIKFLDKTNKEERINYIKNARAAYKEILIKTRMLAKELNLTNSLEYSNLFTYLLWNGYFSKTKVHTYQVLGRIRDFDYYALDIMNGIGVCLNYSIMLKDFLNVSNFSSIIMPCYVENASFEVSPPISRNIDKTKMVNYSNSHKFSNHAINLNVLNDEYYLYDSTNLGILDILNKNKASVVNGNGTYDLLPATCVDFASTFYDYQKIVNVLKELNKYQNNDSRVTKMLFDNTWLTCMLLFSHNKKLLEDYQGDILTDIFKVSNNLEKIKVKRNKY